MHRWSFKFKFYKMIVHIITHGFFNSFTFCLSVTDRSTVRTQNDRVAECMILHILFFRLFSDMILVFRTLLDLETFSNHVM